MVLENVNLELFIDRFFFSILKLNLIDLKLFTPICDSNWYLYPKSQILCIYRRGKNPSSQTGPVLTEVHSNHNSALQHLKCGFFWEL